MSIAPALLRAYPTLSEAQRTIVSHSDGPLLIIAGPGSGKTFSLVLRAMNLLVLGQAVPRELVLCTFTEKAALELRDRMAAAARKIGYTEDLSELKVSTIHGLCNRLLTTHRHRTPLGNNYETLEELTQLLFLFEHFEAIVGLEHEGRYVGKWTTKWSAIEGVRGYFDKMTEERIDPARLLKAAEPFLRRLGAAYTAYQRALFSNNRLDFAHQQRLVYDLLRDSHIATAITRDVRYVMVDEYQDTNFIQEQLLPQWPYVQQDLLAAQSFVLKDRRPVKRAFSFTGDLKVYETCPRQYQFFREYDFTPSRSAVIFFGLLVHQTIEEIHRRVLDGQFISLNERRIRELFERTFTFLSLSDVRPIGEAAKESAFTQVMHYFLQNQEEMQQVIETEVDVSVEKDGYIPTGKVDLLLGGDGRLELLDFKTSPRPAHSPVLLAGYERQLCTYAHILQTRYGKRPDRLLLYWTAEPHKQDALMEFPYRPERVAAAGAYFDQVVAKILQKDFTMLAPPEPNICKECDFRRYCAGEGTIWLEDET
jgi:ATP-dependent exoDNAse (exonuclease V) beta subunit